MLSRFARHLLVFLIALAVVVIAGVIVVLSRPYWCQHRIQEAMARQLADMVHREVAVGPVTGDPLTHLSIDGIAIAEGSHLAGGAMFTARRVTVTLNLAALLAGRALLASVKTVDLYSPHVRVVRNRVGVLNLQRLFPQPAKAAPPEKRFRGLVALHDGEVVYEDRGRYVKTGRLRVRLDKLNATIDFSHVTRVEAKVRAAVVGPEADGLTADLISDSTRHAVDLQATLQNVDLAWADRMFSANLRTKILGGRADLNGFLYSIPYQGKQTTDFSIETQIRQARVYVSQLGAAPLTANGGLWLSMEGATFRGLRVAWGGSHFNLNGSVADLHQPLLDVGVSAHDARLASLLALVPARARADWQVLNQGMTSFTASIIGPNQHADVRMAATLAAPLAVRVKSLGRVQVKTARIQADVVDTGAPVVRATVTGSGLQLANLAPLLHRGAGQWPRQLDLAPIGRFNTNLNWCSGRPVIVANLHLPAARADALRLSNISADVSLIGQKLALRNVKANALGGVLAASGDLTLKPGSLVGRMEGRLSGFDLATLQQLPLKINTNLSGTANARLRGVISGKDFSARISLGARHIHVADLTVGALTASAGIDHKHGWHGLAEVTAGDLARGGIKADGAQGLLALAGDHIEVQSAYLGGPEGLLWARGAFYPDGNRLDLQVRGAELALHPLLSDTSLGKLSGYAYVGGAVSGTIRRPAFTGQVTVFDPSYDTYRLAALTARVNYNQQRLAAESLYASRGSTIISGAGSQTKPGAKPEKSVLRASVEAEGVNLADVPSLLNKPLPLAGLAEASVLITGTMAQPEARGLVRLANARYQKIVIDHAQIPFSVNRGELVFNNVRATTQDAPVKAHGVLQFGHPDRLDAGLSIGALPLQGLAPLLKTGVPLGGEVTIPSAWARGPLDNLQGGGHVIGQDLQLGNEQIKQVDANFTLGQGQLQLAKTSFHMAGGDFAVSGALAYAKPGKPINVRIEVTKAVVPRLLDIAAPLTETFAGGTGGRNNNLKQTLQSYALRLRGNFSGNLAVSGPLQDPAATGEVKATGLMLDGNPLPDVQGHATVSRQAVTNASLALRQGQALVTFDGDVNFSGNIDATVEGSGIDLVQLRPWLPLKVPYGGQAGFTIVASGRSRAPSIKGSLDVTNPSFAGVHFDVLTIPIATVADDKITVDSLILKRGQQEILLDGELPFTWNLATKINGLTVTRPGLIPQGPVRIGGKIEKTNLAFFVSLLDEYLSARAARSGQSPLQASALAKLQATGTVDSSVNVTGTVASPQLRGFLKLAGGNLQLQGWKQPLSNMGLDVGLTGSGQQNLVEIHQATVTHGLLKTDLTGRLWLDYINLKDFWHNRFDLTLQSMAKKMPLPGGSALTEVTGRLNLKTAPDGAQVLQVQQGTADLGDGQLALNGSARFTHFTIKNLADNDYNLHLIATGTHVRYDNLVDASLVGHLDMITPQGQRKAVVRGQWNLSDGIIGVAVPSGGHGVLHAAGSRLPDPALDVTLKIGDNLTLRGSGANLPLEPDPQAAKLTGTPQAPYLTGQIVARQGTTTLPAATLRIQKLEVHYVLRPVPGQYENPLALELTGSVDGLAQTTVAVPQQGQVQVKFTISGTLPNQVRVIAESEPTLTEPQIYALLGGVPFAYLPGVAQPGTNTGQVLSQQFLAGLATAFQLRVFQPLEEELKERLGLAELGVTFAFDQPITLKVGKYILRNLLVSYESAITQGPEQSYDLNMSYVLPDGLRVSYHTDETGEQRVELGYVSEF